MHFKIWIATIWGLFHLDFGTWLFVVCIFLVHKIFKNMFSSSRNLRMVFILLITILISNFILFGKFYSVKFSPRSSAFLFKAAVTQPAFLGIIYATDFHS